MLILDNRGSCATMVPVQLIQVSARLKFRTHDITTVMPLRVSSAITVQRLSCSGFEVGEWDHCTSDHNTSCDAARSQDNGLEHNLPIEGNLGSRSGAFGGT